MSGQISVKMEVNFGQQVNKWTNGKVKRGNWRKGKTDGIVIFLKLVPWYRSLCNISDAF